MKKIISFILSIALAVTSVSCFAKEAQSNNRNEQKIIETLKENKKEKKEYDMIDKFFNALNISSRVLIKGLNYSIVFIGTSAYLVVGGAAKVLGKTLGLSKVLLGKLETLCLYVAKVPFKFYAKNLSKNIIKKKNLKEMYNSLPEEAQKEIKLLIEKKDAADSESLQYSCIIDNILKGKSFSDSELYCLEN